MVTNMDNGMENMLELYLFETTSLLEKLDEILLEAEKANTFSSDDIDEIFRAMHTVKGSSAMMQFESLMTIAHHIEDLFFVIREQGLGGGSHQELFNLMFKSCDFLKLQVEKIQNNEPLTDNIDNFVEEINSFLENLKSSDVSSSKKIEKTDTKMSSAEEYSYSLKVLFDEGSGMENLRAFMLVNSIRDVVADFIHQPDEIEKNSAAADIIIEEGFHMHFKSEKDVDNALHIVQNSLSIQSYETYRNEEREDEIQEEPIIEEIPETEIKTEIEVKPQPVAKPAKKETPTGGAPMSSKQSLINVNLTKLDKLMAVVGEIVITESMVASSPDLAGLKLDNFTKSARQLRKLTDELQDIVMSIRMVPVASVFTKMHRIVRDLSHSLNKQVKLTVIGEDTEVDKTIVDHIGDPVMHIVRNSMDHGIESDPQERINNGKDPVGEIILEAEHTGSEVVISIRDDGKGIDTKKVLAKAVENNLITKPENEYTQKEILQLVLMPGFSTKTQVTELSGRGVGMDVVKKNIEKVGGTVSISSTDGEGSCTTMKIPLTLAIVDGMEVAVGKSIFTMPITNIRQSFKVSEAEIIYDPDRGEMIKRMDNFYPILRLHELYNIPDAITDIDKGIIMWLESGDKSYCLFVDELLGEHQVVVKPLPTYFNNFNIKESGIAGCTIMGDGNISIILDILNLYDSAKTI